MEPAERPDLCAAFQSVDTDGSGVIDYDELDQGLEKLGVSKTAEDKAAVKVSCTIMTYQSRGMYITF